ncbi:MAG: glutathione S-transferase family protein [Hyphomonadaceae bacterium]
MITIHNFQRGGRGLRVAWQCDEMGLPYKLNTFGYPPPAEYLAKHSIGNVPFLEDGETGIHESVAIMLYLASRHGPTPLLPGDARYGPVLELTVFTEATFGAATNTLMAAHFAAPDAEKNNWSVQTATSVCERAIGYLADRLGARAFLVGDDLTLADIGVATALGVWRGALGKDIPQSLTAYRERLTQRPAYQRAAAANGNA